tara:strand:- start:1235 stop:1912 length:678 start_codon:yes stop_codon:yes gene_type:complete
MDTSKRHLLASGGLLLGGAALMPNTASAALKPDYIWALTKFDQVIPSDEWVILKWDFFPLNTTNAIIDDAQEALVFNSPADSGMWAIVCNIAWDNALDIKEKAITPPTHRKLARIVMQDVGKPQIDQPAHAMGSTDLTYHSDLALLGDQDFLADGSNGYQQQQVYVQTGFGPDSPSQRFYVEVYQNSGQDIVCRFDGGGGPQTETRSQMVAWQAPSWMLAKISEF